MLNTTKRQQRKNTIKKHYDQHAKPLPELKPGDMVFFQTQHKEGWEQGIVTKKLRSRTYIVTNPQGTTFRRNRVHIRKPRDYKEHDIHNPAPLIPSLGSITAEALTNPTASEQVNHSPKPEIPLLSNRPSREHKMWARFENFVMY